MFAVVAGRTCNVVVVAPDHWIGVVFAGMLAQPAEPDALLYCHWYVNAAEVFPVNDGVTTTVAVFPYDVLESTVNEDADNANEIATLGNN